MKNNIKRYCKLSLACLVMTMCMGSAFSASTDNAMFLYAMPWDDVSANFTNISTWNEKPAGAHGFITARNGHLYEGDKRLRFLGSNLVFDGAFPTHEEADKIAARMARFGLNVMRLHHMDTRLGVSGSILEKDGITLNPDSLDRLDYFIAALKREGIYCDINLHVGRTYPGFTQWRDEKGNAKPQYWKGVDNFFSPMITMQQDYARALLTHANPYTKTRYVDEPAVAFIEINNENSLTSQWLWGALDAMTDPMLSEFRQRWDSWLLKRYGATPNLEKSWGLYETPMGGEMFGASIAAPMGWTLQSVKPAQSAITSGSGAITVNVSQVDGTSWHVQLHHNGLSFKAHTIYTLKLRMRADPPSSVALSAMQNHAPWASLWRTKIDLGTSWREYNFTFVPTTDEPVARFTIGELGNKVGTISLADASLRSGGSIKFRQGIGLEQGTVPPIWKSTYQNYTPAAQRDWIQFLWDTESAYWGGMGNYIKNTLKAKSLLIGTQVGYSPGPIQAKLDVVDGHAYWQHPSFPHKAWDADDWFILDTPMAGIDGTGTLAGLALARMPGKPFVVTEYNHPAPSEYAAEALPLVAAYAALQDWDGLFIFDYQSTNNWNPGYIRNYFDIHSDPDKMNGLIAASAIFRRGDVATPGADDHPVPGMDELIESMRTSLHLPSAVEFGAQKNEAVLEPTSLGTPASAPVPLPVTSVTGQLVWGAENRQAVTINSPKSKGIIGAKLSQAFDSDGVHLQLLGAAHDTGVLLATLMEGKDFSSSGHILITALGEEGNSGQVWRENQGHPTLGRNWGSSPVWVEGIAARVILPVPASRVEAYALDERGNRRYKVPVTGDTQAEIETGPQYKSLWYEVVVK